jgi:hypothetical protein
MRGSGNKRATSAWLWVALLGAVTIGALGNAARVETAPAPRAEITEIAVVGHAGGFEANIGGIVEGVVVATREPDGTLNVECTDHETAAAIMAEVRQ